MRNSLKKTALLAGLLLFYSIQPLRSASEAPRKKRGPQRLTLAAAYQFGNTLNETCPFTDELRKLKKGDEPNILRKPVAVRMQQESKDEGSDMLNESSDEEEYLFETALFKAVISGKPLEIKVAIHSGEDVNMVVPCSYWNCIDDFNDVSTTLLHRSLEIGHYQSAITLINNGAKIDAQNFLGETALHEAVERGDWKAARLLLNSNASVVIRDYRTRSPLYVLGETLLKLGRKPELMALKDQLIKLGGNARDFLGHALVIAARDGDNNEVEWLLSLGADPNVNNGDTPPQGGEVFFDYAYDGETYDPPIINAACGGYCEVIETLADAGADTYALDYLERSVEDLAQEYGEAPTQVIELLEEIRNRDRLLSRRLPLILKRSMRQEMHLMQPVKLTEN